MQTPLVGMMHCTEIVTCSDDNFFPQKLELFSEFLVSQLRVREREGGKEMKVLLTDTGRGEQQTDMERPMDG